ncbi:cobyrinate a,c-diamide synthase [Telmatospirillum sp. J64-1]|uniref:cobyrinate a,c-diamide synthase n=1 Tax=Telmatospirillum sp. J64-1 TaxID=2502183 RepID=UPI0021041679|nr:cobyrinate a,c-diamide synthase [Telmatospirillum sp. J64-1]
MNGLIIAAPSSGSGKTMVTLGLLRLLARKGLAVASAKVGPDYIDPGFHAAACGGPCRNLDGWAMRPASLSAALSALGAASEIVLCEGVMGLFDGANVTEGPSGSTAEIAALSGWPVVLVVDVRGQSASAAAVIRGFADLMPEVTVAGVIFNRCGSANHVEMLTRACARHCPGIPVLGCLPRLNGLETPSRHLGLVQAREHAELAAFLDQAADLMAEHLDIPALLSLARPTKPSGGRTEAPMPPLGQRIAIARDDAFSFTYAGLLDSWRTEGAELAFFSPLADEAPPEDCDGLYLPGGYPELHAGRLAAADRFMGGLRAAAARGAAIFGECGGFMTLGESLTDAQGQRHAMAGLLPLETSFAERRLHLGYRRAVLLADSFLGPAGRVYRGHEFHYATITRQDGPTLFRASDAAGRDMGPMGLASGKAAGSFLHVIDHE